MNNHTDLNLGELLDLIYLMVTIFIFDGVTVEKNHPKPQNRKKIQSKPN